VKQQAVQMPGRIYERINVLAQRRTAVGEDLDLCEAVAEPRLKRRGAGFTAQLVLEIEQIERLVDWIGNDQPKFMRDYRDQVRRAIGEHREGEG
jgi:hypothetical protein